MFHKSSFTLAVKLMFYSAVSVFIAIAVMGVLFTFFLNSRFRDYLLEESRNTRENLVENLSDYMKVNPEMDQRWLEQFSNVYMEQGMFISLSSEEGDLMWSCLDNNSEMCNMHMEENNLDYIDNLQVDTYKVPMGSSGESSYLNISYMPPDQFSGNDHFFLRETYKMLIISMIISLLASALTGILLSRTLSRPLSSLVKYAVRLSNHDYNVSDSFEKGTREIDDLHLAIEKLAHSLESQEKLRKRLTSDISHELRTPLTTLQTSFEAMIDGIWPCDEKRLQSCHDEIQRLTGLVHRLDALHTYDTGNSGLKPAPVDLGRSLTSAFLLFEKDFQEKGIKWKANIHGASVMADEGKLKQVWINLISNSLKFIDSDGLITVSAGGENPVRISFSDNGTGIDREDLPNIFERFYKADTARNATGSGLGLSIVKEIIEAHKGHITVSSEKNIKTEFIIEIPGKD